MQIELMKNPVRVLLSAVALFIAPITTLAQDYPTKPVKLIVPFPPGASTNDLLGRLIAQRLSEALGQQFVVENRAGAGGTIGTEMVAKAPPDGYTLLIGTNGPIAIGPHVYPKLGYDPLKDLEPVSLFAMVPYAIVVNANSKANTLQELVTMAKGSPGKLAYASSGNGSPAHLCGELMRAQTGIDIVHVPYKGGAPAANDLISGQVQIYCPGLASVLPMIQSGKLKALAVTMPKRTPFLPDVPTSGEQGLGGLDVNSWVGLMAPAGTPRTIINRLNQEVVKALTRPDVRSAIEKAGAEPATVGPADFSRFLSAESSKWSVVVKKANVKMD